MQLTAKSGADLGYSTMIILSTTFEGPELLNNTNW
jgi:hypothetical protein